MPRERKAARAKIAPPALSVVNGLAGAKVDEMVHPLNPLDRLCPWRVKEPSADKLYGAIVAQARLPVFYQEFGVPDTLAGRFVVLSLHLFAVLHRLKAEGAKGLDLAQGLVDRFGDDMETVLRELGVSDLRIPKTMRGLAASSAALLDGYEQALASGEGAFAATIAEALPLEEKDARAASARLASYLRVVMEHLQAQSSAVMDSGELIFPGASDRLDRG